MRAGADVVFQGFLDRRIGVGLQTSFGAESRGRVRRLATAATR